MAFNKRLFSVLLQNAKGTRSLNKFAAAAGVSSSHVSRLMRELVPTPPAPETLKKLATHAENGVTYEKLMNAAGYTDHDAGTANRFGQLLKQLRQNHTANGKAGLTQKELATIFNIDQSTIAYYESGRNEPDFEMVKQFADFFSVTTDYLLGKEPDTKQPDHAENLQSLLELLTPANIEKLQLLHRYNISVNELKIYIEFSQKLCHHRSETK